MTRKFNLTKATLSKWFKEYNARYFDNSLHNWDLTIDENSTSFFGKCFYTKRLIKLCTLYDRDEKGFQTTMIHEMIHAWQYDNNLPLGHGKAFKMKAALINKDGWNVRTSTEDHSKPVKGIKPRKARQESETLTMFVWINKNGRKCFSLLTKSNTKNIVDYVKAHLEDFKEYQFYTIPNTDEMTGFRRSSKLAYYFFDKWESEIRNTFNQAIPLAI